MKLKKYLEAAELLTDVKYNIIRMYSKVSDIIEARIIIYEDGESIIDIKGIGNLEIFLDMMVELDKVAIKKFKEYITV